MSSEAEILHRRHLPHLYLPNAVYFVTFRLAGSLPDRAIEELREKARLQKKSWISFVNYDKALDNGSADVHWLSDKQIANLVLESIRLRDGSDFDLATCCIMPNHVHIVFGIGVHDLIERVGQTVIPLNKPTAQVGQIDNLKKDLIDKVGQTVSLSNKSLSKIMQSLKGFTASKANDILQRSGPFWQDESYDHIIRSEGELERVVKYVVYNPVKAGLVKEWREWMWTYTIFDVD
jgi:putative transposase